MTVDAIMDKLREFGHPNTKKTLMRHGAKEPVFGVKVADIKKIVKLVKKNYDLSLALYDTGNSDAMYLAGLIADEKKMTKADLQKWANQAYWYYLSEYTVPWVASESDFGYEMGLEWIDNSNNTLACTGWQTLACLTALKKDEELNLKQYQDLLDRIHHTIYQAPNRVRFCMNAFIIAVGCNVEPLNASAMNIAKQLGKIKVDMGDTACKIPEASVYIQKVIDKNRVGKKRKTVRC